MINDKTVSFPKIRDKGMRYGKLLLALKYRVWGMKIIKLFHFLIMSVREV
ncbi:MAG: hypothetical protein LBH43_15740 [Treponema sp.]|jgi:hypothetical protein|nr:hypothetical protein [Treponema sp.]